MTSSTVKDGTADDRVLVIGATILDQYYIGRATRLDQTAAVPVVDVSPTRMFSSVGGGANAAANVAHLAMPVAFVSVVGEDAASRAYADKEDDLITKYLLRHAEYQLPQKHRVYAQGNLAARFDVDERPKVNVEDQVVDLFHKAADDMRPSVILVSDYDKGVCTPRVLEAVMRWASANDCPVIVDPVPAHTAYYKGATALLPNERELLAMLPGVKGPLDGGPVLCQALEAHSCIVTCGDEGLVFVAPDMPVHRVPAVPAKVIDTCGAGDAVAAAIAYGHAVGMKAEEMLRFAAVAGAVCVENGGAGPVSLHEIHRRLAVVNGPVVKNVGLNYASLLRLSVAVRKKRFGITNGVFDILHPGHVSMLEQAAAECDFLLVMLNSDESALRAKGRAPVNDCKIRAAALSALPCVGAVLPFDEDTPELGISFLAPDLLVKGPEHAGAEAELPGAAAVLATGGVVHTTTLEYDIHASDIITKAKSQAAEESAPRAADAGGAGGSADAAR